MTIANRYDFVLLFDVQDGNPNGDPDNANLPRLDTETGEGIVTDVCLKRKVRNYVTLTRAGRPGYEIYVAEKAILTQNHVRAYQELGIETPAAEAEGEGNGEGGEEMPPADTRRKAPAKTKAKRFGSGEQVAAARAKMCELFYDVRTFGAVMSTGINAGQVRGPVQLTFARSKGPVVPVEHTITRMAVATEREAEQQKGDNRTMGRKATLPYGLYRAHGFVSASLAAQTGFADDDLSLLWEALTGMFEHDRSAARGLMATRELVVFRHDSALGNAPAHKLFERVQVDRLSDVPRGYGDFRVTVDDTGLPAGVTLQRLA